MKTVFLILSIIVSAFSCNAQLYSSNVHFYIKAGSSLNENTTIYAVKFWGDEIRAEPISKSSITNGLRKSTSYWEEKITLNERPVYCYNSNLSTYTRTVYNIPIDPQSVWHSFWQSGGGYEYFAFSSDKSSFIFWKQKYNSEDIRDKSHYIEIDISKLMPNENIYDFLND